VDLPAELDLLARARRIVASAPERALQLTAEHARRYQEGVLAQEREVLAIDALMRLGHRDLAATRARRFIERYPDSAHRVRLATELEAP
jgi:outer membrane protein assembly factor BamD (BamD/ComL family)